VLNVNSNGKGASYRISDRSYSAAPQETGVKMVIPEMPPDMIAGILASWIEHSCEDLLEGDWLGLIFLYQMFGLLQDSERKMK